MTKTPVKAKEIEERRKAFLRKWRPKCRAVADSLEEAGDRLLTFTRLPPGQWRSARTTNAVERLHEEFRRRIKTQTVLPSPETAAMLSWALLDVRTDHPPPYGGAVSTVRTPCNRLLPYKGWYRRFARRK